MHDEMEVLKRHPIQWLITRALFVASVSLTTAVLLSGAWGLIEPIW